MERTDAFVEGVGEVGNSGGGFASAVPTCPGWTVRDLVTAVDGRADPVWTYLGPRPAAFWTRRTLHDTVVHHADLVLAAGSEPDVPEDVAADAVDELFELFTDPAGVSLKPSLAHLRGTGETLLLRPRGRPPLFVVRTPGGPVRRSGEGPADVVLTAPPPDLLLVLTRRRSADHPGVRVEGDRALLDHWVAHTAL
ncbi:hypothetical protein GCM10009634_41730 [Saccharothrix xinjiangensis]